MKGIIYKYTSPSGKSYVGQTTNELKRKREHYYSSFNMKSKAYNYPFHVAIRKYGFDSFDYCVLWTIIDDNLEKIQTELDKMEIYYIGLYDTFKHGYNQTIGGKSCGRGENHPSYGTKLSEEHKKKLKASRSQKVWQFDLKGDFIMEFDSAALAQKETGADSSGIIKCCKKKHGTVKGFQWRYAGEDCGVYQKKKPSKVNLGKDNHRSKKVGQYDKNGNLIKTFDAVAEISRELNINLDALYHTVNKNKLYKNYYWKYIE